MGPAAGRDPVATARAPGPTPQPIPRPTLPPWGTAPRRRGGGHPAGAFGDARRPPPDAALAHGVPNKGAGAGPARPRPACLGAAVRRPLPILTRGETPAWSADKAAALALRLVPLPTDRCDIDGPTAGGGPTVGAARDGAAQAAKASRPPTRCPRTRGRGDAAASPAPRPPGRAGRRRVRATGCFFRTTRHVLFDAIDRLVRSALG
jgi:hypothetical protein